MTVTETSPDLWEQFRERDARIAQHRKTTTRRYYDDIREAREKGVPVAYCTGATPPEILYTMGVQPCMPENYVTICCAKQLSERFLEAAEAKGYSRDLCSYSRVGLGMMFLSDGPYGALPKPDFVLSYPMLCDPHAKWWEVEAQYFKVPLLRQDGPVMFREKPDKSELDWMVTEIEKLFSQISQITGKKFDYDRFKEVMELSSKARELWTEISLYTQAIPCPRGLREVVGDLFYVVTQLGTPGAVEYFTMVRDDVRERVKHKVGIIPEEKFRLIWDNVPLWYRLQLIDYFGEKGAAFVTGTYPTAIWLGFHFDGGHYDPEKPWESLALFNLYTNQNLSLKLQMRRFEKMVREWHCDGAVFHSNRGCQVHSRAVLAKERLFRERTGALSMSFEAEMADPRSFHEAEVKARIESFLETLAQRKSSCS